MIKIFTALLSNPVLMSAIFAWFIAQMIKVIREMMSGSFRLGRFLGEGGMPSSHTAMMVSMTYTISVIYGAESALFGISSVVMMIVMYDAAGVRRAAGRHARVINRIVQEMKAEHPLRKIKLKEIMGHSPVEVLAGAIEGLIVGWITCRFIYS